MEEILQAFFRRYEALFRQGLKGDAEMAQIASSYASAFIAASPAGVSAGRNDEQLPEVMRLGFERYRRLGTRGMVLRHVRVDPIDTLHALAHVGWTATYGRDAGPDVRIDFEVHYLVQLRDGEPRIFGWVSGDEEALLKQHGIL